MCVGMELSASLGWGGGTGLPGGQRQSCGESGVLMRQVPHGGIQSVLEAAESWQGTGLSVVISRAASHEGPGFIHSAEMQEGEEVRLQPGGRGCHPCHPGDSLGVLAGQVWGSARPQGSECRVLGLKEATGM